jgi:hypothetical protein
MAHTLSCTVGPAHSPSESGPGMRSSPSAGSSPAWMRTLSPAVCNATANSPAPAPAHFNGSRFQTPWSLHLHTRSSRVNAQESFFLPLCRGVFACPRPVAPSQPPQQWYPQRQRRLQARIDLLPRPHRGKSLGGTLWRACYAHGPVGQGTAACCVQCTPCTDNSLDCIYSAMYSVLN